MRAVEALEKKLAEYAQRNETRRTWEQWVQWVLSVGGKFSEKLNAPYPGNPAINYHQFLTWIEPHLAHQTEMLARLTSPDWLASQEIRVAPPQLSSASLGVYALQKQLEHLSKEMIGVQQRLFMLENQSSETKKPASTGISTASARQSPEKLVPASFKDVKISLEKEFVAKKLSEPAKPKETSKADPVAPPAQPQRLEDTYLSVNDWLTMVQQSGIDLQKYASASLRVPSSHQISFKQFGVRIERRADDIPGLRSALRSFQEKFAKGVSPGNGPPDPGSEVPDNPIAQESPPTGQPTTSSESGSTLPSATKSSASDLEEQEKGANLDRDSEHQGFHRPDPEEYRTFGDWVKWLQAQGIDPQKYAAEPIEVKSSHQISFNQFCKRLERQLSQPEAFKAEITP